MGKSYAYSGNFKLLVLATVCNIFHFETNRFKGNEPNVPFISQWSRSLALRLPAPLRETGRVGRAILGTPSSLAAPPISKTPAPGRLARPSIRLHRESQNSASEKPPRFHEEVFRISLEAPSVVVPSRRFAAPGDGSGREPNRWLAKTSRRSVLPSRRLRWINIRKN